MVLALAGSAGGDHLAHDQEDHGPGGESKGIGQDGPEGDDDQVGWDGGNKLRFAREDGPSDTLPAPNTFGAKRQGDGHPFGDIMDGDGNGYEQSQTRFARAKSHANGQTFRKAVDEQRGNDPNNSLSACFRFD